MLSIARESVEYLKTTVTADVSPEGTPEFAFTDGNNDDDRPDTWTDGTWTAAAAQTGAIYTRPARLPLIGTGGLDLAPGFYRAWIRVTDTPEIVVQPFDYLTVT